MYYAKKSLNIDNINIFSYFFFVKYFQQPKQKVGHPDLKTQGSVVFPPRAPRGWPADEFCYFDGIAKFFFG